MPENKQIPVRDPTKSGIACVCGVGACLRASFHRSSVSCGLLCRNRGDFEGEKYVLARGIKLMEGIVGGWKSMAAVEVPIEKAEQEYIPLFI